MTTVIQEMVHLKVNIINITASDRFRFDISEWLLDQFNKFAALRIHCIDDFGDYRVSEKTNAGAQLTNFYL